MSKVIKRRGFIVLGVILVLVIFIFAYFSYKALERNKNGVVNADNIYEVKTGNIELSQEGVATLVAAKETNLYFNKVSGVLQNINVKVNDIVTEGQLIGEISSDDINLQLKQAEIEDKMSKVNSQKIELSINNMNKTMELSKIDLDSSVKILDDARIELDTAINLKNDPDKVALKKAQSDYDNAQKENRKANLVYEQNENQLNSLKLDRENLNYSTQSRLLKNQDLNKSLDNCKLVARTGGKITFVDNISVLDYIAASRVIAKIVEENNYVLQFTSSNISDFSSGMKVQIKINGENYNGEVYEPTSGDLIKVEDSSVKTKTQVYFKLEKPIKDLSLGARTTISVATEEKTGVIIIPKSAIKENGFKFTVNKYNDGKIETVEIVKGIETGSNVEVIDGLNVGDKIISGF